MVTKLTRSTATIIVVLFKLEVYYYKVFHGLLGSIQISYAILLTETKDVLPLYSRKNSYLYCTVVFILIIVIGRKHWKRNKWKT